MGNEVELKSIKEIIDNNSAFKPELPRDKKQKQIKTTGSPNIDAVDLSLDAKSNEGVYKNILFVSFDVCNSTELKVKYQRDWIEMVEVLLSNKLSNMSFWKFNGDEILYCTEVHSLSFIIELIKDVSRHVDFLQSELKTRFNESIFIKSTIWIAQVNSGEIDELNTLTNVEFYKDDLCDYVGINIDEGFRLCSHASPRKVVLDPKLVYLLLESYREDFYTDNTKSIPLFQKYVKDIIEHIYFYQFVSCKGIWKNRKYPTYWYIPNNIEEKVHYDEVEDIANFKSIMDSSSTESKKDATDSAYRFLRRIFNNVEVQEQVEALVESFKEYKEEDTQKRTETVANLYYMVTCINPTTGHILLAKRTSTRQHLKGVWDFGNVKFQKVDIPTYITKAYKDTFGIDIELQTDETRGGNVVPHGCCKIYRNCNPHNGLLCHAIIQNPRGDDAELVDYINNYIQDRNKYSEVKFINSDLAKEISKNELTIDEIRDDSEYASRGINNIENTDEKCLMYICNSIKSAEKYYQEYKSKYEEGE